MPDSSEARPTVRILGTHGVPANYGGFETAAENVARYLTDHGWRAIVYCQTDHEGPTYEDQWNGIERVNISVANLGWLGTAKFDWLSILHAVKHRDVCLTFGYNTGIFNVLQRVRRVPNVINMDGIEWSRKRWGLVRQSILYINERFAAMFGNELIADHPELNTYLRSRAPARKITTITYGAHRIDDAPVGPVEALDLEPKRYLTLIARPIPENSILELVQGFSAKRRGINLVVLGAYDGEVDSYHRQVLDAASDEVKFLGAIYDPAIVQPLRYHALGYLHGHTVGGTNPSLVEALAAGNPVIAHNNKYNTWVADDAGLYFRTPADAEKRIDELLYQPDLASTLSRNALNRFESEFTWDHVAGQYEVLLRKSQRQSRPRAS
ncbi:glycosyltransferase family 1 protein [Mycobacterium hodleri]|uniref:Glycosyltransferase family 1 protein n=1 Tax=Mycolicibacterium hodleri TaxID=49897 RepID=A0A544VZF1_9MYCO|nr:glycosyltransferase family 1 protein [Mycolicibacterium hodleri]